MVHPYLVYQTLNALTLKQLQQLSFEFKLKIPANTSKKKLLKILMKPQKYMQTAGGRIESTPPIDQEVEFRRLRQLRIEKLEPIVKYYKELCKDGTPIEDQETLDSLTEFQIPFIDPITQEPLEINDIVFIHNKCWSKKQLTEWVKQSIDKTTKPSNPLNKANFSLAEIKELGLNPKDFRHTYSREVPLSSEEIRAQSIRQETEQARRQRMQELQQRQATQQLRVQQEQEQQQARQLQEQQRRAREHDRREQQARQLQVQQLQEHQRQLQERQRRWQEQQRQARQLQEQQRRARAHDRRVQQERERTLNLSEIIRADQELLTKQNFLDVSSANNVFTEAEVNGLIRLDRLGIPFIYTNRIRTNQPEIGLIRPYLFYLKKMPSYGYYRNRIEYLKSNLSQINPYSLLAEIINRCPDRLNAIDISLYSDDTPQIFNQLGDCVNVGEWRFHYFMWVKANAPNLNIENRLVDPSVLNDMEIVKLFFKNPAEFQQTIRNLPEIVRILDVGHAYFRTNTMRKIRHLISLEQNVFGWSRDDILNAIKDSNLNYSHQDYGYGRELRKIRNRYPNDLVTGNFSKSYLIALYLYLAYKSNSNFRRIVEGFAP